MDVRPASRAHLDRLDPLVLGAAGWRPQDLGLERAGRRDFEVLRYLEDRVGSPDRPSLFVLGRGRQISRIALTAAAFNPPGNGVDLVVGQALLVLKSAVSRVHG